MSVNIIETTGIAGNITERKTGGCGKKSGLNWRNELHIADLVNSNNLRYVSARRGQNRSYSDHRDWKRNRRKVLRRRICVSILILACMAAAGAGMLFAGEQHGEFSEVDNSMESGQTASEAVGGFSLRQHKENSGAAKEKNQTQPKKNVQTDYTQKVSAILQNPELPTGCEATAGTMLLQAYGYEVEKTELADLLEKGERVQVGDQVYGPDPQEAFIGDPASSYGYGAFPKVLAKAMEKVIAKQNGQEKAEALEGKSESEILSYIDQGIPVCVWASIDNREIERRKGWYLIKDGMYTDAYFYWPSNEHVLVLTGYDENQVTVCDPLKGETKYDRKAFFRHYEQVGKYALLLI
nr:C39 family peptidase [uncultured Mediterraneibacter sp.]